MLKSVIKIFEENCKTILKQFEIFMEGLFIYFPLCVFIYLTFYGIVSC